MYIPDSDFLITSRIMWLMIPDTVRITSRDVNLIIPNNVRFTFSLCWLHCGLIAVASSNAYIVYVVYLVN